MRFIIGVDIGGTFTDASAVSIEDDLVYTAKAPSTPQDLTAGLVDTLQLLAQDAGLSVEELMRDTIKFAHGTTQTSNVMFTWSGARTGLITTQGFGDEILIMRARGRVAGVSLGMRRHLRATEKPPKIVSRRLIREVSERVDYQGKVVVPLQKDDAVSAIDELLAQDVESIAVSLLWSFRSPDHELMIESLINERAPEVFVSLGHRLAPVVGEYERASTAVVNAYVGPTVEQYLGRLSVLLRDLGLRVPLLVLQSNGGVVQADKAIPVNTIESGPAAGMVAVQALAESTGYDRVIATDVGGTTFKVGLLVDGAWSVASETIVNQYSLLIPMIDLVSIGAGGGSIAWVDDSRLRIGPDSAGSEPGPACYGWGGTRPTVTDADLVLGFLNPDRFLGGRLKLRVDLAETAIKHHIADALFDGDLIAAAAAIRSIVDAQMGDLVRKETIERGYDPREFVLVAYGGAGPLHAAGYARGLGVTSLLIPEGATAYSAYGAAASELRLSLQRSVNADLLDDGKALNEILRDLESQTRAVLESQGVTGDQVRVESWADLRYERQLHDVRVALPPEPNAKLASTIRALFEARYAELYGLAAVIHEARVMPLRLGVVAIGETPKPELPISELHPPDPVVAQLIARPVYWPDAADWVETKVFDGDALQSGHELKGPAVIEKPGTTVLVPAGVSASVDRYRNLILDLRGMK